MAIINLSFEEVKANSKKFQSKYNLTEYVTRTTKELIGIKLAKPIRPIYQTGKEPESPEETADKKSKEIVSNFGTCPMSRFHKIPKTIACKVPKIQICALRQYSDLLV